MNMNQQILTALGEAGKCVSTLSRRGCSVLGVHVKPIHQGRTLRAVVVIQRPPKRAKLAAERDHSVRTPEGQRTYWSAEMDGCAVRWEVSS